MGRLDEKIKQRLFEDSVLSIYDVSEHEMCRVVGDNKKTYENEIMARIKKSRTKEIMKMKLCGMSCSEIADFMGVSPQRIYQIYSREIEKIKNSRKEEKSELARILREHTSLWSSFEPHVDDAINEKERHFKEEKRIHKAIYFEKNRDRETAYAYFCSHLKLKRSEISDDLLGVKVEHLKLKRSIRRYRRNTNG